MSSKAAEAAADDRFQYWSYKDLAARGIVTTRQDLYRKRNLYGFPKPVVLTGGQGANARYRVDKVKAWLIERETLALKNSEPKLKPDSRPRGRPKKHPAEQATA